VFLISTYSLNCDAAVRRRSLEMTTPDGEAADACAAAPKHASRTRSGRTTRRERTETSRSGWKSEQPRTAARHGG
jgi:hypothetical protein